MSNKNIKTSKSSIDKNQKGKEMSLNTNTNNASRSTRAGNSKTKVVKTTMFAAGSLDIIRSKIIKNRAPQKLVMSSERVIRKEIEELKIVEAIKKDMKTIRKSKAFLGLVDTWKFKVLEIANNLTDYVPEENRSKIKKTLNTKIRKFRVENVPLIKPRYSS